MRKDRPSDGPVRYDEGSSRVDGFAGCSHHRLGLCREGEDDVAPRESSVVVGLFEEADEAHVGGEIAATAEEKGGRVTREAEVVVLSGEERDRAEHGIDGLITAKAADAEHAEGGTVVFVNEGVEHGCLMDDDCFAAKAPDLGRPVLARHHREGRAGREEAMEPLKASRDVVALGAEAARVRIEADGGADDPSACESNEPSDDRRVRHDDETRAAGEETDRPETARDIAERGMPAPALGRGVEGKGGAAEAAGDLLRTPTDGSPREVDESLPTVSAVVATHDRANLLTPLVDALMADPVCSEVIVVDDASSDDTPGLLASLASCHERLVTIRVEHRAQLLALQAGVAAASGEVVLLLDDDVLPGPALARGHARHHARRSGLVVLGYMPVAESRLGCVAARLYAAEYEATCADFDSGRLGVLEGLWTGNVSLRRSDALVVGIRQPLEAPTYHQDRDLGYRLSTAGLVGVFDRSLRASHLHTRDRDRFLAEAEESGAGLVWLHTAHAARLGTFTTATLTSGLPALVGALVLALARTERAVVWAKACCRLGAVARSVGLEHLETRLVRVARRVMRAHGALAQLQRTQCLGAG